MQSLPADYETNPILWCFPAPVVYYETKPIRGWFVGLDSPDAVAACGLRNEPNLLGDVVTERNGHTSAALFSGSHVSSDVPALWGFDVAESKGGKKRNEVSRRRKVF